MKTPRAILLPALLSGAVVLAPLAALAQYRPPPASEGQRLTYQADDIGAEAAKLDAGGQRKQAEERYRKACDIYEKALAAEPQNAPAAAGLGAAANAIRDYGRTAKNLGPVRTAHPEDTDVAFYLGVALFKLKRYGDALPMLEQVSKTSGSKYFMVHYYLGWYGLAEKHGAHAVEELDKYLQTRPPELASADGEIHDLRGQAYLILHNPALARAAFERAQRGRPEVLAVQLGFEQVLEMEDKPRDAIALLDRLVRANPKAPEPRERLGRMLLKAGDVKRAEGIAADLLRMQGTPAAHVLMGDVRIAERQFPAAEGEFRQALRLAPTLGNAQIGLSRALQLQGRNDEAIASFESAVRARPNDIDLWAGLGSVCRRAGRYQRAVDAHKHVLELAPTSPLGHTLLAADHFATGQWDDAIDNYNLALKIEPTDMRVRHFLALALSRRAQIRANSNLLDDAILDVRRALDLERTPPMARTLGAILLSQRQWNDARFVLKAGSDLPGADWHDHLLLGYAHLGAGDARSALVAFERAAGATKDAAALTEVYAGWALSKIELGDYDMAVSKLQAPAAAGVAAKVMQANLPLALVRRALGRLHDGDIPGAVKDIEAAGSLFDTKSASLIRVLELAKGLVAVEKNQFAEASSLVRKALSGRAEWADPAARPLFEAYVEYRRGREPDARKQVAAAQRLPSGKNLAWIPEFVRAIYRREGEQAYAQGQLAKSEQALKSAAANDPLNPYVTHNMACIKYRRGGSNIPAAVQSWQQVADSVPEAQLNLGIWEQEHEHNPRRAVEHYRKYAGSATGARAELAREWADRLSRIHGIEAAPAAAPAPAAPTANGGRP